MIKISDSDSNFFTETDDKKMNIVAVLCNSKTGEKTYLKGKNIVTTKGNRWYATRGALEASNFAVNFLKLGIGSVAVSAGDNDVYTSMLSGMKSIDAGYPMTSDTDADNTGRGSAVVSWRVTFNTTDISQVGIRELALGSADGLSVALNHALNHALFAAAFDKTANDTLKVFVNHALTGV